MPRVLQSQRLAMTPLMLLMACGAEAVPEPASLRLEGAPAAFAVVLRSAARGQVGYVADDSAARLLVRAATRGDDDARLCGLMASRTRAPVPVDWGWPVDSASLRLAPRVLSSGDVQGVRFVLPGTDARYVFEGLTRDGAHRVSVRWPVVNDPARPVPVGAPDSLIEQALVPSPRALDSLVGALRLTRLEAVADERPDEPPSAARAVPVFNDLPLYELALPEACREATVALSALARVDQRVRIAVRAGDEIRAHAVVANGTVRVAFDEAPPRTESRERQSEPQVRLTAVADGRLTLRVRVQVLPRAQAERQTVLLRVRRDRPSE
jgi:hypothetical protein